MIKGHLLIATAPLALSMAFAAPAFAQDAPTKQSKEEGAPTVSQEDPTSNAPGTTAPDQAAGSGTAGDVVVTGSRIRRPNLDSPVPVTSISGGEFFETGQTSIGDVLNELPALRSTFSQSNSTRFLGTSGLNLIDLRGLGTQRTLVLVNGRRHVAGDILNTAASVDTNTIPTDLIERTDIVTGGNSAIYGSDALAGVVNFVLKDHFEGLQLRGQGGVSDEGDAGSYYASLLAGKNFAGGRGNIAVNLEYAHQNSFYASDRKQYRTTNGFVTVDTDPGTAPSDGKPDAIFARDIRNGTYSNAGTFLTYFGGDSYTPLLFQPNGTLIPQTGTAIGLAPLPSYLGGNGDNFRDGTQFAFQPDLDRYSANLIGHFDISDALVPFFEAKYVRTDSFGSASGPFFTGAVGERFFTDNPYLSNQARGIIRDYYGVGPTDNVPFVFYKNAVELTNRSERARRETYRGVVGLRGRFNDDWSYELSANYGEFREHTKIFGNVDLQRYQLAIDAVDQGLARGGAANGQIVCRSQVTPSSASTYAGANQAFAQARLAADIAACVPVNLFGNGNVTQAARNYLLTNATADGKITQFVASGFLNGDTSGFFNLPGGPVGFAVGAEYRRETAFYTQDATTQSAITFYNSIPTFNPTSFEVKEAFGEVRLPLLRDRPFFHELTVSGAVRVADYKGSAGTVLAYNGGVEWAPAPVLRFRGNYSRAVRAPNLSDLYTPLGQNYDSVSDPCSLRNIGAGSATRQANCRAAGVPTNFDYVYRATLGYQSGGNPNLAAEKSDSYTVGGIFEGRGFLRGFTFSADYYNISVNNVISSPSAQGIINACYDAATLNNQFCGLFQRNRGTTNGPLGEIPGRILENSLQVVPLNYAKLHVSGIDFEVGFQHKIGGIGDLAIRGIYTLALQNDSFLNPVDPNRADRTLSELGDPQNAFNINASLKSGPVTFGYKLRYLDRMTNGAYENYYSVQGRAPQNADAFAPEYTRYPVIVYQDLRLDIDVQRQFNFYVGVDNITDQLPPFGLTGAGGGSSIYQNIGRFLYVGVRAKL